MLSECCATLPWKTRHLILLSQKQPETLLLSLSVPHHHDCRHLMPRQNFDFWIDRQGLSFFQSSIEIKLTFTFICTWSQGNISMQDLTISKLGHCILNNVALWENSFLMAESDGNSRSREFTRESASSFPARPREMNFYFSSRLKEKILVPV